MISMFPGENVTLFLITKRLPRIATVYIIPIVLNFATKSLIFLFFVT